MGVAPEKTHFGNPLVPELIFRRVETVQYGKSHIHARDAVVEPLPYIIDIPGSGQDAGGNLKGVENVAVLSSVATLVGIVGTHVIVPKRKR